MCIRGHLVVELPCLLVKSLGDVFILSGFTVDSIAVNEMIKHNAKFQRDTVTNPTNQYCIYHTDGNKVFSKYPENSENG